MTQHSATETLAPPPTGIREIDDVLTALVGLDDLDVAQHHERLATAQDVLTGVLDSSRGTAAIPQALRTAVTHG